MGPIMPLSLIGIIATFLLGVLVQSPVPGNVPAPSSQDGSSIEVVHQAADRMSLVYGGVISDLVDFQKQPDYQRAEAKRQQMRTYAQTLLPQFQAFIKQMQGRLDQLTAEHNVQTTTATTETTTATP